MPDVSIHPETDYIGKPPFLFRKYIDRETIQDHVAVLAQRMRADYENRHPVFVGVLSGAFMFLADLVRETNIACDIDFIKVSSYRDGMSSGKIVMSKDLETDISERHVILVDDIVDTGNSWAFLKQHLMERRPASLRMAAMFRKPGVLNPNVTVDYIGMDLPNAFVVGYGLDHAGQWRQLPDLYILAENE
jgi:hypoxanthine phosphoribosyltransferase